MKLDPKTLIIDRPDWVGNRNKFTAMGITLFFWGALLYLWQPAISLLAWSFNIRLFYSHMVVLGGYQSFLNLLVLYGIVITLLSMTLLMWAKINQWRFTGVERRKGIDETDQVALSKNFSIDEEALRHWQQQSGIRLSVDENSQIVAVNSTESPSVKTK